MHLLKEGGLALAHPLTHPRKTGISETEEIWKMRAENGTSNVCSQEA